jgi:cytochrome c556
MNKLLLTISLCAALGLSAPALAASHAAGEKMPTWEEVKTWTVEKKNDAVTAGKKMLAATDKKLDELSAQAKKSGTEASEAHKKNMQELKAKRAAAAAELDKLGAASATAWNGTRDAFANAYRDLTDSHDKASGAAKK